MSARRAWSWAAVMMVGAGSAPAILSLTGQEQSPDSAERRLMPGNPAAEVTDLKLGKDSLLVTTAGNSVFEYSVPGDSLDEPTKWALPSPLSASERKAGGVVGLAANSPHSGSLNEGGFASASSSVRTAAGLLVVQRGLVAGRIVHFPQDKSTLGSSQPGLPDGILSTAASSDGQEVAAISTTGSLLLMDATGKVKKTLDNSWLPASVSKRDYVRQPFPFAAISQTHEGWTFLVNRPNRDDGAGGESLVTVSVSRKFDKPKAVLLDRVDLGVFSAAGVSATGAWAAAKIDGAAGETQILTATSIGGAKNTAYKSRQFVTALACLPDGSGTIFGTWRTSLDGVTAPSARAAKLDQNSKLSELGSYEADISDIAVNPSGEAYALATSRGDLFVKEVGSGTALLERPSRSAAATRLSVEQGESGLVLHYSTEVAGLLSSASLAASESFDLGKMRLSGPGKELALQRGQDGLIKKVSISPGQANSRVGALQLSLTSGDFTLAYPTPEGVPTERGIGWKGDIYYIVQSGTLRFYKVNESGRPQEVGSITSPKNPPLACFLYKDAAQRDSVVVSFQDQSVAFYDLTQSKVGIGQSAGLTLLEATIILWLGSEGNWFSVEPKTGKFAGTPEAIKSFGYSVYNESTGEVRFVSAEQLQDTFLDASYVSQVAQGKSQAQALALSAPQAAAKAGYVGVLAVLGPDKQGLREFQDADSGMNAFETNAMEVTVRVTASDGLTKEDIRVSNGISAKSSGGGLSIIDPERGNEFDLPIKLYPGDNHVRVYAAGQEAQASGETILIKCTAPMTPDSNVWNVLVVAIPQYDDPSYRGLPPVVNDGKAVSEAFESVKDSTAVFKVTKVESSETTRDKLDAKIKSFLSTVKPGENLLIYASAHGDREGEDFYLITKDAKHKDLKNTAVSWNQVSEEIRKKSTRNALIILDACHSGEAIDDQRAVLQVSRNSGDAVAIWASSSASEKSYTLDQADQLKAIESKAGTPAEGMSVFTIALVEGLKGYRFRDYYKANWDGVVDLRRLHLLVGLRVIEITDKAGLPIQTPMIWGPSSNVRLMNLKGSP